MEKWGSSDASPRSTTVRTVSKALVLGVDASLMGQKEKENDLVFCNTLYKLFCEILAEHLRLLSEDNSRLRKELARYRSAKVI